jgi:hypothetical protein
MDQILEQMIMNLADDSSSDSGRSEEEDDRK